MKLSQQIEALLFHKSEPLTLSFLKDALSVSEGEVWTALGELEGSLKERGVRLLRSGDSFTLGTAPEASALIEKITKEELERDLGKAAVETLTIVLYDGPITKSEIDYIRGVNSNFILRNLLIRGLVERKLNPEDGRSFVYKPSLDLLSYLGITKIEDLPEYEKTIGELTKFRSEFGGEEAKE